MHEYHLPECAKVEAPKEVRYMKSAEILRRFNLGHSTLFVWMKQGRFPRGRLIGKYRYWSEDEINAWLAEQEARELERQKQKGWA